jgi:hypothetical protein
MPRIKRVAASETYGELSKDSRSFDEKKDCAVIAVAVACEVSYAEARAALAAAGRKDKSGTQFLITREAIESLGFRLRQWTFTEVTEFLRSYPGNQYLEGYKTITTHHPRRFPKIWKGTGTLLFRVSGHICCCKDGVVHDWAVNASLRVHTILSVEKAGWPTSKSPSKCGGASMTGPTLIAAGSSWIGPVGSLTTWQ